MSLPNRSPLNVRYSLIFLKLIIRAILIDYLPGLGVWQMGPGGNGETSNTLYMIGLENNNFNFSRYCRTANPTSY